MSRTLKECKSCGKIQTKFICDECIHPITTIQTAAAAEPKAIGMQGQYPEYIMKKLRQREDLEPNDKSLDEQLQSMTPYQALSEVMEWEGFIGYTGTFKGWIKDTYGIDIDELVKR